MPWQPLYNNDDVLYNECTSPVSENTFTASVYLIAVDISTNDWCMGINHLRNESQFLLER